MKRSKQSIKRIIKKKNELRQGIAYLQIKGKRMGTSDDRVRVKLGLTNRVPSRISKAILIDHLDDRTYLRIHGKTKRELYNVKYSPILEHKEPISIYVTEYQTQDYIEECLDSIKSQTYFINNDDFEILVGVDGCQETLNKLLKIKHKYKNLRIFMLKTNVGTYVTSNTLLSIVKNENIIRFDSDDIMRPEMINEIMTYSKDYDLVRFHFYQFKIVHGKIYESNIKYFAQGVIYYTRKLLDKLGGYMSWECAGDSDFLARAKLIGNEKLIDLPLFHRRIHDKNLIFKYDGNSEIRIKNNGLIGKHDKIKIQPTISNYSEIINL